LPQQILSFSFGLLFAASLQQDLFLSDFKDGEQQLAAARKVGSFPLFSDASVTASAIPPDSQVTWSCFGFRPLRTAQTARSSAV
jgi:hypothetical protein